MPDPYAAAHYRVKKTRGAACSYVCPCGASAVDWALTHDGTERPRDHRGREYSDNPDDYQPLRRKCHTAYDSIFGGRDMLAASRAGSAARRAYWTPDARGRQADTARRVNSVQVACAVCGKSGARAHVGRHQQVSGHREVIA